MSIATTNELTAFSGKAAEIEHLQNFIAALPAGTYLRDIFENGAGDQITDAIRNDLCYATLTAMKAERDELLREIQDLEEKKQQAKEDYQRQERQTQMTVRMREKAEERLREIRSGIDDII